MTESSAKEWHACWQYPSSRTWTSTTGSPSIRWARSLTQREEELGYRPTADNQGRIGALREPLPCWSAFTEGHVTAEGGLSACCFDATANWTMGDLNRLSFVEAWNSEAFLRLREAHLRKDVRGRYASSASPTDRRVDFELAAAAIEPRFTAHLS